MRIFNVIKNSSYALGSFAFTALMAMVVRKFFTMYLSVELLGVEGLFSGIISVLSLAEMGLSSIISYGLYKELANNNRREINTLMNIYRQIYAMIGVFVAVVGFVLFFFLPYIIRSTTLPWSYIQFAYVIQIGAVLSGYFLAYKRTLLTADQKDYVCIQVDTTCTLLNNICRVVAIVFFQSYILYAGFGLVFNVVANMIIARRVKSQYPFLHSIKVTFEDIRERRFFKDIKNLLIQRFGFFLYGGTDSIFISGFLGLHIAGLFANYQTIHSQIFSIMYKALQGIVPSIGNLVYADDKEKRWRVFEMLDFVYILFGAYIASIYAIIFQPFIKLFFGSSFVLPECVILVLAAYVFLMIQFENLCNFRSAVGFFERDRNWIVLSGLVKVAAAVPLISLFDVAGLVFAGAISWCFIGIGRLQIVFEKIFVDKSKKKYLLRHLLGSILVMIEISICYVIFQWSGYNQNLIQLTISGVILMLGMTVLHLIFFHQAREFPIAVSYLKNTIHALRRREH